MQTIEKQVLKEGLVLGEEKSAERWVYPWMKYLYLALLWLLLLLLLLLPLLVVVVGAV